MELRSNPDGENRAAKDCLHA